MGGSKQAAAPSGAPAADGAVPVRRALLSVSDKTGIVDFAAALRGLDVEILSTGGTARLLAGAGIPATEVSEHTGFPEMLGGRVKTLHPKIHGGILGRRDRDAAEMRARGVAPIDLVAVNLYPFEETVADPDCDPDDAVERIDVGGPAMLRAAAKNHRFVAAVADPADYGRIAAALEAGGGRLDGAARRELAARAFEHTAAYDAAVAGWLAARAGAAADFPRRFAPRFERRRLLRYGENPHQRAALYVEPAPAVGGIAAARQLQGKELSYNNIADADAALECVKSFDEPACVIVKHANPCGAAIAGAPLEAYERAHAADPTSAFGGVIAFNRELDERTVRAVVERQFAELIVAPAVSDGALAAAAAKSGLRVLACGEWPPEPAPSLDFKRVGGGLLVQDRDILRLSGEGLRTVTRRAPDEAELRDLLFAWRVVRHVKSNAIVYCRDGRTVGIGAGQMSRVDSARIAARKAAEGKLEVKGAAMASDAFFPFRDGIDAAAAAGVAAVIQPGGSKRDPEAIAAADEAGMAMVFTGARHFRH